MYDDLIKGVASAIRANNEEVDAKLSTLKREIKTGLMTALSKDFSNELIKDWKEQRSYKPGDMVRHRGGVFQAWTDTESNPLEHESGWVCVQNGIHAHQLNIEGVRERCLTTELSDGTQVEQRWIDPVVLFQGTWDAEKSYDQNDEVAWGGGTWRCLKDAVQSEPGTSPDWSMATQRGKQGKPGPQGDRGPQGEKGDAGADADPMVAAKLAVRQMEANEQFIKALADKVNKGILELSDTDGDAIPMRFVGDYEDGRRYERGDVVTIRNLGVFQATRSTVADPRRINDDQWIVVFANGGGASSGGGTSPFYPLIHDTLTVAANGQTAFLLSQAPQYPTTISLSVNGQVLYPNDITLVGTALTYSHAAFELEVGDKVVASYM